MTQAPSLTLTAKPTATLPPTAAPTKTMPTGRAYEQNRRLGRGVNLGNALEAPTEGEWGVTLQESYFQLIKDAGFNSVRIPINWSAHAGKDAPYTIDASFFDRVDWAVNQALARGLTAILDMHNYAEMVTAPLEEKTRFLALWKQIAEHYRQFPDSVFFEILNEPNSALDAEIWNQIAAEAIVLLRQSNPDRIIIVGPSGWNNIYQLTNLKLPQDDHNIIVTVHYYEPFHFTHQGAEWVDGSNAWLGTKWTGDEVDQLAIGMDFETAVQWAQDNNRPLFLGEFGAYSKGDMDSRARWTSYVARTAEAQGMSWAYWEFCSGFGVYDPTRSDWNEPLLKALIP